jgi:prepilin-type N-terminal cleavage/methylation domain-containing protein
MTRHMHHGRQAGGYTLVEILITLAILGIIAGIAFPIVFDQSSLAWSRAAQSDAQNIGIDIATTVAGYQTFGDTNGTIAVSDEGFLTFSPMANANPYATGPEVTNLVAILSADSTVTSGSYGSGMPRLWCITVTNNTETAVFTNEGLQLDATSCNTAGQPVIP